MKDSFVLIVFMAFLAVILPAMTVALLIGAYYLQALIDTLL